MNSHSRSRWRGSSDAEGSSSSSTGGSASRPTAMFTRWRLPPDSLPTLVVGALARGRSARASARRPRRGRAPSPAARTAAGSRPPTASSRPPAAAGTQPTSRGGTRQGRRRRAGCPARIDSSVVLPAPLGPMIATSSPRRGLERHVAQRHAVAEALRDAPARQRGADRGRDGAPQCGGSARCRTPAARAPGRAPPRSPGLAAQGSSTRWRRR